MEREERQKGQEREAGQKSWKLRDLRSCRKERLNWRERCQRVREIGHRERLDSDRDAKKRGERRKAKEEERHAREGGDRGEKEERLMREGKRQCQRKRERVLE